METVSVPQLSCLPPPRRYTASLRTKFVIWDIQTGVIIGGTNVNAYGQIILHADQRTSTIVSHSKQWIYNILDRSTHRLHIALSVPFHAHWINKDTLQFVTGPKAKIAEPSINIYGFQPTSASQIHLLTSLPMPYQDGSFSFCPVSSHASFVNKEEVIILNAQDAKLLLQAKVVKRDSPQPGQFSADGQFFACHISMGEIHIWQNTTTSYVLWNKLRLRLPLKGLSWSPTSTLLLGWGTEGIQLLDPGHQTYNQVKPYHKHGNHLVGYSTDGRHIVTTHQWDSVITVFSPLSDTPHQSVDTGMDIQDIKVIGNTIFVVDGLKLSSWDLMAGVIVHDEHSVKGVAIDEALAIDPDAEHLALSHDCSKIAFSKEKIIFLYDVKSQKSIHKDIGRKTSGFRFSLDGTKLWPIRTADAYYLKGLELVWDLSSGEVTKVNPEDRELLFDPPSPHGYHIGVGSEWVEDSKGTKIMWLPLHWRIKDLQDKRWDGDYLALVGNHYPQPILIKFQS